MARHDAPFTSDELVGRFTWDAKLTNELFDKMPWVYHAFHREYLRQFYKAGQLFLRSKFQTTLDDGMTQTRECLWTSIQDWNAYSGYNHHGPLTVKVPLDVLDDRRFYVFERRFPIWRHFYFVQRETRVALFDDKPAKLIDPLLCLFQPVRNGSGYCQRRWTQYEIVLTKPVPLERPRFVSTAHEKCVLGRDDDQDEAESVAVIEDLVGEELRKLARQFPQVKRRLREMADEMSRAL